MRSAAKFLLALLGVLLALGLGEGLVRGFDLGPDLHRIRRGTIRLTSDPGLRYELVPNVVSTTGHVLINEHGMRNRPVARAKPPGVRRIACVGDSIAFGMGSHRDHFSVQLEERLNAGRPEGAARSEVLNFGVPGYHVGQVAAMLAGRAADFAPDLVLYLYCLNDPQETSRELEDILRADDMSAARNDHVRRIWASSRSVLGGSRLWNWIRLALAERFGRPAAPRERYRDDMEIVLAGDGEAYYRSLYAEGPARDRLRAGLDRIARWSGENAVPVWVVVFPVFADLDDYPLEDLHRAVAAEAAERGLRTVDLLPVYREAHRAGAGAFYADPLHPNEIGYGIAARAVAEALAPEKFGAAQREP